MHCLLNCSSGSVERPIVPENGARFNLLSKTNGDAKLDFRFDVSGVLHLFHALRIPRNIILSSGRRFDGLDELCVMLRRLAYPARLHDLRSLFPGRSVLLLGSVFTHVVDFIIQNFDATIYFAGSLVRRRLADYCAAVHANGAPLNSVFGFIDGTKIEICEPVDIRVDERRRFQKNPYYSGAKREFCLGFQAVTAPDGTCIHFRGPLPGARHDMALLYYSGLLKFFGDSDDDFFRGRFVYGDLGYGLHRFVMTGYRRQARTVVDHQAFNTLMDRQRACVQWNFGRMKMIWAFMNDKHQMMKIGSVPVDKFVKVSMFLSNCDNYLIGGNQGSQFFNLPPSTIEEYLGID